LRAICSSSRAPVRNFRHAKVFPTPQCPVSEMTSSRALARNLRISLLTSSMDTQPTQELWRINPLNCNPRQRCAHIPGRQALFLRLSGVFQHPHPAERLLRRVLLVVREDRYERLVAEHALGCERRAGELDEQVAAPRRAEYSPFQSAPRVFIMVRVSAAAVSGRVGVWPPSPASKCSALCY
jgi:hypothetical protein